MALLSHSGKWDHGARAMAIYLVSAGGVALCVLLLSASNIPHKMAFGNMMMFRLRSFEDPIRKFAADLDDDKVLNVHVVPHTHDDVGWLKTVDQYYYGLNTSIQPGSVHTILDNVVAALSEQSARTFVYVETKYFSMWWKEQTEERKELVRDLVANRQFQFANGGWCMHDEAGTHFMGMLDQTTLGHQFLLRELGYVPRVGWQLDPFGHSSTQASLFTARAGFDALYFGRIDHQDLSLRRASHECEGLWHTNLNDTVFWGLTGSYYGGYNWLPGFCYDYFCRDEPLVDMDQTHFDLAISDFLTKIKWQSDITKGNHIMLTMGADFEYERAIRNFANLDVLIAAVTQYQSWGKVDVPTIFGPRFHRVNVFYSTPEYYTDMKAAETKKWLSQVSANSMVALNTKNETPSWSIKSDDFFPYSDCDHGYWTGYFTSRTSLKRFERVSSSFLLAARQVETLPNATNDDQRLDSCDENKADACPCGHSPLYELEDALGVVQHHDGVSGTSKQHVANDYGKRLHSGIRRAERFLLKTIKSVVLEPADVDKYLQDLAYCQLLNETVCEISQNATVTKGTRDLYVIVYNSLAAPRSSVVSLPVSINADFNIRRLDQSKEDSVVAALMTLSSVPRTQSQVNDSAPFALIFQTGPLPPAGAAIFKISTAGEKVERHPSAEAVAVSKRELVSPSLTDDSDSTVDVSNGIFTVKFDRSSGSMIHVTSDGINSEFSQQWGYYESFDASKDGNPYGQGCEATQNSGAYIFRPSQPNATLHIVEPSSGEASFYEVAGGTEVHIRYAVPWIKQVVRILPGVPYIEVDYTVGPIPIDDGRGKEVVTRYLAPIASNGEFYTDSNGREFLKRSRDFRPSWNLTVYQPIAGNFYPVNTALYLQDNDSSLAVLVDRSQGGASLLDGSVELMVQRRTIRDDSKGLSEAINETVGGVNPYPPYGDAARVGEGVIISGRHRILMGKGPIGAKLARSQMDNAFAEPLVFVASSPSNTPVPFKAANFSVIQASLPANVMLITLMRLHDAPQTTFLIRLGHQFAENEDEELSKPVKVDLGNLLSGYEVLSVIEKTLTGNQNYTTWLNRRLSWEAAASENSRPKSDLVNETVVDLSPMEIKTFEVSVKERQYQIR